MQRIAQRSVSKSARRKDPVFDVLQKPKPQGQKSKQTYRSMKEGVIDQTKPSFIAPDPATVPRLKHGLDRVLFSPGVHQFKDLRTGVYNFPKNIETITQPEQFNFKALPPFRRPSQDTTLHQLAKENKVKFVGSTSSVSSALSQIYFSLSKFKEVSTKNLDSGGFVDANTQYTAMTRMATSIQVSPSESIKDVYTIDYYKHGIEDKNTIMMSQGHILENFFTLDTDDFQKLLADSQVKAVAREEMGAYAYCQYNDLLLRSQIDCMHPYLPKKTFDIKTRASVAIRLNAENHAEFVNYKLNKHHGWFNSYAKEYYDMMRSAFLKYCFQVRIGDMDGLFVSYHNTRQIFGFQYVSREELDEVLFGNTYIADSMFGFCLGIFEQILQQTRSLYGDGDCVKITMDAGAFGLKIFTTNNEGQVHKLFLQTDLKVNDEIVDNFDSVQETDKLSVNYRLREYTTKDEYSEEFQQLEERIVKRLTKAQDSSHVHRMRSQFKPYMSEDELDTLDVKSWNDQV